MAFAATDSTAEPRAWSIGPLKMQVLTFTVASGDTSGTITADALSLAQHVIIDGVRQSAAATYSGNVVTLTLIDPAATVVGTAIVLGR